MPSDVTRDATRTPSALPGGTRLGEFELRQVLGVGGFGIVYLAFDHALEREVAIKEYMPAALVGRTETMHVTLRSQNDAEVFAVGLRSFVNEARMLARFDHPSLLKVHRFWEANGTAYMAMPVLHGKTLKELRQQGAGAPDEARLRHLLEPLLGAIERLHNEGVYHRDIAPDNIQIEPDGRPVLMDFGAARRVMSDKSQHLTAILKPAYAPIEQYAEIPSVKQGPWTDLYALGATVHYMLLGKPPTPSTARAVHDDMRPLSHQEVPGCSVEFLRCIDWMLAPRPGDRPQSVAQLREAFAGRRVPPHMPLHAPPPSEEDWQTTVVAKGPLSSPPAGPDLLLDDDDLPPSMRHAPAPAPAPRAPVAPGTLPAPAPSIARVPAARQVPTPAPAPAAQPLLVTPPAAPKSKLLPAIGGLAVVAALAIGAAVALWPKPAPTAPVVEATPTPAAPAALPAVSAVTPPPVEPAASNVAAPVLTAPAAPAAESPTAAVRDPAPAQPVVVLTPTPTPEPAPAAPAKQPAPRPVAQSPAPAAAPGGYTPPPPRRNETVTQPVIEPSPRTPPPMPTPPAPSPGLAQAPPAPSYPTQQPAEQAATGPEAICGARGNPVMNFVCMERECLRSRWSNHADCARWRASRPQN